MELFKHMINIETTNSCCAKCSICPRDAFTPPIGSMDMKVFKKIIDEAVEFNTEVINLCGFGEAFMDRDLFWRLDYVKSKLPNSKTYISTNAFLMKKYMFDNIIEYVDSIKFSIFGVSPEVYHTMHRLNRKSVYANVESFLKYIKDLEKRPYTTGLFVMTDDNYFEKDTWLQYWESKFDEVYIWKPHNWLDKRYRVVDKTKQQSCMRPFNTVYVHVNGDVSVCCWDLNKQLVIGDIKTQTFKEIYAGEPIKRIREKHSIGNFEGLICADCDQTNNNPENLVYHSNPDRKLGDYACDVKGKK